MRHAESSGGIDLFLQMLNDFEDPLQQLRLLDLVIEEFENDNNDNNNNNNNSDYDANANNEDDDDKHAMPCNGCRLPKWCPRCCNS